MKKTATTALLLLLLMLCSCTTQEKPAETTPISTSAAAATDESTATDTAPTIPLFSVSDEARNNPIATGGYARLICASGGKVYFSDRTDKGQLCASDSELGNIKVICEKECDFLCPVGDKMFFINTDTENDYAKGKLDTPICSVNTDGSDFKELVNCKANLLAYDRGVLVYNVYKDRIYSYSEESGIEKLVENASVSKLRLLGDYMLYSAPVSTGGNQELRLYSFIDKSDVLVSDEMTSTFSVVDDKVYYLVGDMSKENTKNYAYDLSSGETEEVYKDFDCLGSVYESEGNLLLTNGSGARLITAEGKEREISLDVLGGVNETICSYNPVMGSFWCFIQNSEVLKGDFAFEAMARLNMNSQKLEVIRR